MMDRKNCPSTEQLDREVDELLAMGEDNASGIRSRVKHVSEFPPHILREKEVQEIILSHDLEAPLDPKRLLNLRRMDHDGRLMLAEYMYKGADFTFLYVDPNCPMPSYLGDGRQHVPIEKQAQSTLFKISDGLTLKTLHTWDD